MKFGKNKIMISLCVIKIVIILKSYIDVKYFIDKKSGRCILKVEVFEFDFNLQLPTIHPHEKKVELYSKFGQFKPRVRKKKEDINLSY